MVKEHKNKLVGFAGDQVNTRGYIDLLTTFRDRGSSRIISVRYVIVEATTSYNILIGRLSLNKVGAIVLTPHLTMKFPSNSGEIISIRVDQKMARQCYADSLKVTRLPEEKKEIVVEEEPKVDSSVSSITQSVRLNWIPEWTCTNKEPNPQSP